MGKELTLQELAAQETGNLQKTTVQSSDAIKTATEVSVNALAKNLPGKEPSEDGTKPPKLVEDAVNAMYDRLDKSKKFISEEVMPVVKENIKEMKIEQELGEAQEDESTIDPTDEVQDEQEEVSSYETPKDDFDFDENEEDDPATQPVQQVSEPKQEDINSVENPIEQDISGDISDIDDLISELDKGQEEFTVGDNDVEETVEEARERFKETLNKEIKVTKNEFDFSEFTIDKNPVSSSVILNSINNNNTK